MNLLQEIRLWYTKHVAKHGLPPYCELTVAEYVDEQINAMTNVDLLQIISDALEGGISGEN